MNLPRICQTESCDRPLFSKGKCRYHYQVDFYVNRKHPGYCTWEGCKRDRAYVSQPYCNTHFRKAKETGVIPGSPPCPSPGCTRFKISKNGCSIHSERQKRKDNPGYDTLYRKHVRESDPERHRKRAERKTAYQREIKYDATPKRVAYKKQYCQDNLPAFAKRTAHRRAMKLKATPHWTDQKLLHEIYLNCPEGYEVDHIIPLNHPQVCGLHIPANLQYLPATENRRKSNHVEGLPKSNGQRTEDTKTSRTKGEEKKGSS